MLQKDSGELVQVPAKTPGRQQKTAPVLGPCTHVGDPEGILGFFCLAQTWPLRPSGSEPVDGNSPSRILPLSLFQTNKYDESFKVQVRFVDWQHPYHLGTCKTQALCAPGFRIRVTKTTGQQVLWVFWNPEQGCLQSFQTTASQVHLGMATPSEGSTVQTADSVKAPQERSVGSTGSHAGPNAIPHAKGWHPTPATRLPV